MAECQLSDAAEWRQVSAGVGCSRVASGVSRCRMLQSGGTRGSAPGIGCSRVQVSDQQSGGTRGRVPAVGCSRVAPGVSRCRMQQSGVRCQQVSDAAERRHAWQSARCWMQQSGARCRMQQSGGTRGRVPGVGCSRAAPGVGCSRAAARVMQQQGGRRFYRVDLSRMSNGSSRDALRKGSFLYSVNYCAKRNWLT